MSLKELALLRKLNHNPIPEIIIKATTKANSLKQQALLEKNRGKRAKPKNKIDLIDVERVRSRSVEMGILARRINAMNKRVSESGEDVVFYEDEKMLLAYLKIYTDIQYKNRDLDLAGAELSFIELQETIDKIFTFVFEMPECEHNCHKKFMIGITNIVE